MIETQTFVNSNIKQKQHHEDVDDIDKLLEDARQLAATLKAKLDEINRLIDEQSEMTDTEVTEAYAAVFEGEEWRTPVLKPSKSQVKREKEAQAVRQQYFDAQELVKNLEAQKVAGTQKIPQKTKPIKAPGPKSKVKTLDAKPQVKHREDTTSSSDSSSDSGHSSDGSVETVIEKVKLHGLYQPNIVSVDKLPSWDKVMENHVVEESYGELTTIIAESVGNAWFTPLFGKTTPLLVSALGTSLLSIGTSINSLFQTSTTINKILNITTIVSSLVTLVLTVAHLLQLVGVSFDSNKVIGQIPQLAATFNTENKANSSAWIYPAISAIVSLIIGGLTAFNVCDIKSVIEKGSLIRSGQHISGVAKTLTKFLLEDMLHLDITGDQEVFNDLHMWAKRSAELATLPFLDFLRNTALLLELQHAVEKSLPILASKYHNKEMNVVSRGAFTLIVQNLSKLQDKLAAIKVILSAVKRQETLGVLFAGEASVGKSTLAQYAAKKIAEKMGYDPKLYNLNMSRKDGFYGPYGGQDFGSIDEFMALRSEDPNLPQLNQILSGDHFNFEAAHLEGKSQPSALKCVFLTSNNICPSFVKVLDEEAAKATWDRILRFEVIDPLIKGRQGLNSHRKPNFSHLRFRFVENTRELVKTNLIYKEVTIDEVIGMIIFQMAKREESFITQHQIQDDKCVEQGKLKRRLDFLQSVKNANASNSGQCFKVFRVQGPLGTGKTRIVNKITHNILRSYIGWKKFQVVDFDQPPTERGIYIIDDIIMTNRNSYESYLKWINQGHSNSLYVIVTNTVMTRHVSLKNKCKSFFQLGGGYTWRVSTYGAPNGVARRLGLHGNIETDDGSTVITGNESVTIDVPRRGIYKFNGEELSEKELIDFTYRTFEKFVVESNEVQLVDDNFEGALEDFDATIVCDSVAALNTVFRSKLKIISSCITKSNGVSISFKPDLFNTVVRAFEDATQMMPGSTTDEASLVANALNIASTLNDVFPGVKAKLTLSDTRRDLILCDRRLYIGVVDQEVFHVNHDPELMRIYFQWNHNINYVSYADYAQFVRIGRMPFAMKELPSSLIAVINNYVSTNVSKSDPMFQYHDWYATILKKKTEFSEKTLLHFIKDNRVMSLLIGLVGLGTIVGLTTLCYKLFKSDNKDEVVSNAKGGGKVDDDEYCDENIREHVKKYRRALLTDTTTAYEIREAAYKEGHREAWNRWEEGFRSNAMNTFQEFNIAMTSGNITRMAQIMNERPDELRTALLHTDSNYLTITEELHQNRSDLEVAKDKFQKNTVLISCRGRVYGIGLFAGLILTVSHVIPDEKSEIIVTSAGCNYTARVVRMNRKRDLAIIAIEQKQFPPFADLRKMLIPEELFATVRSGYFIRPTSNPLILGNKMTFIPNVASPKVDSTNPLYRLEAQFWMFDTVGLHDPNRIFKSGDCGLPLVTIIDNQVKLVGIHNALHISGYAWFSSVTLDDLKEIKANAMCELICHQVSKRRMVVDDKTKKALMEDMEDSKYAGVSPLKIFGYSKALHYYSKPSVKKKYVDVAEAYFTNPKIPAAITMENVKDDSELWKDRRGNINPLFSQAVKYAEKLSTEGTYDRKIDLYVTDIIKTYYRKAYGKQHELKLHEVINGYGNLKEIEMSTSAGPKMKKWFQVHTKIPASNPNVLFVNLNEGKSCKPFYRINKDSAAGRELFNDYHLYVGAIKQGTPPLILSKDNAKVELLPKAKVEKGKVRLFNELDLSINMVLKTFFGSFLEQVIANHEHEIFCIGSNPFLDATSHMLYFNSIEGEYLNADFKALDKSTTKFLIENFVECALQDFPFEVQDTIAQMLTYRLHTMDGHLYFIDSGNCSGSYVTTLMNCHTVLKVSLYTFCRKWQETYKVLPTYGEIMKNCVIRILGDDAIRKFSNLLEVTDADLVTDAATYGLTQTPSKTEGLISFCSRTYVAIEENIYFPKLTKDSIVSTLFWYNAITKDQITANIFVALLEASLHEEEFFSKCKDAAIDVATRFGVDFDYVPFNIARETFIAYIRGHRISPVYKAQGSLESYIKQEVVSNSTNLSFKKMADMWLNEYVQKRSMQQPIYLFEATGSEHELDWTCTASVMTPGGNLSAIGVEKTKQGAKRDACTKLKEMLVPRAIGRLTVDGRIVKDVNDEILDMFAKLGINRGSKITFEMTTGDESKANSDEEVCGKNHTTKCLELRKRGNVFDSKVKMMGWMKRKYPSIQVIKPAAVECLVALKCLTKLEKVMDDYIQEYVKWETKLLEEKEANKQVTFLDPERVEDESKSNADQPIEPATINQSATAMAIGTLPSSTNPQPTGVVPAMTSAGEDIMANLQFAEQHVLQPVGAPNMLSVGAITFDLHHLIYEQFLDADIEYQITDSLDSGAVILQIPYGVNTPWVNNYIKTYARSHERYAGAIQYRFTVIGNPLFSGAIGVAWFPQAVTDSTVLISETQKYAYSAKGVTMPWNAIHTLHDGRQELFWRRTDEEITPNRPHLVVYLMMSLQNPLREGVVTRLRVASKLCNAGEPNPFVFSVPVRLREIVPESTNALSPAAFDDVFVNATNGKINIYTDGSLASQQNFKESTFYPDYDSKAVNISSARRNNSATAEEFSTNTSRLYGPAQGVTNQWGDYLAEWPMFGDLLQRQGWGDPGKGIVSIIAQSNMDAASFSTLLLASPFGGVRSNALFTQNNWNSGKVAGGWANSYLRRPEAPIKILAVLSNSQSYVLASNVFGGKQEYLLMGQYIKVITDQGTAIFYVISFVANAAIASPRSTNEMYGLCGLATIVDSVNGAVIPPYPYLNIDEQLGFTAPIDSLPLGYQALRFADVPPSAVLIDGYPGPTASDNATIARWFARRARGLSTTMCIQFRLVDTVSVRAVATVRYIQELGEFVINTRAISAYRVLPVLTSNLTIQSVITVDRTNDFIETDTSLWFERTSTSFFKNSVFQTNAIGFDGSSPLFPEHLEDESKSNAMLAAALGGGALSGVGNALQAHADRKFQEKMQSNQFGQEALLQGNMFDFQKTMQGNNFDFQKMMQQGNFGQEQLMQERGYQNDLGLLQSQHAEQRITNQQKSQNRMTERGLSARSQFLTNHAPGSSPA